MYLNLFYSPVYGESVAIVVYQAQMEKFPFFSVTGLYCGLHLNFIEIVKALRYNF